MEGGETGGEIEKKEKNRGECYEVNHKIQGGLKLVSRFYAALLM